MLRPAEAVLQIMFCLLISRNATLHVLSQNVLAAANLESARSVSMDIIWSMVRVWSTAVRVWLLTVLLVMISVLVLAAYPAIL